MTTISHSLRRLRRALALSYTAEDSNTEHIDEP
jgi:hypothetical protein